MKVIKELQEIVNTKTTLIKMSLVIKENIDNLDGDALYRDVTEFFNRISTKLSITLTDEALIGLIFHLSFTISRLKKEELPVEYPDKENLINEYIEIYESIKEQTIFLYNKYFFI